MREENLLLRQQLKVMKEELSRAHEFNATVRICLENESEEVDARRLVMLKAMLRIKDSEIRQLKE